MMLKKLAYVAVFVSDQGTAFVDLSREVVSAHPGGSLAELLTVYTLVQVLTTNLPKITAVQLLVDGKEVDTLVGHVDTKHPLPRADAWVSETSEHAASETSGGTEPAAPAASPTPQHVVPTTAPTTRGSAPANRH